MFPSCSLHLLQISLQKVMDKFILLNLGFRHDRSTVSRCAFSFVLQKSFFLTMIMNVM